MPSRTSSSSTWQVYLLAITTFLVGTSEYVIAGILDLVAADLDVDVSGAGQLITLFSLVYAIGTPLVVALTSKIDRRLFIVAALGVFVASNVAAFLAPGYWTFVGTRVGMALAAGAVVVAALNLAVKISPERHHGRAIATVVTGFTASLILGVPAGRLVADSLGWQAVFLFIAAAALLAGAVLWRALPSVAGDKPTPLAQQLTLFRNPKVVRGLLITFFWLGGYSVAYTYLSPYLIEASGLAIGLISAALLAFGIASLIGSKAGGYLTDRWGVLPTLLGGMGLHVLALLALSLVTGSPLLIIGVLVVWSLSAWSTGPTQQYHLATIEPGSSGVLLGLNQSMMQLAMAAGAGLGGLAVTGLSIRSVSWIAAAGVLVAIAITASTARQRPSTTAAATHAGSGVGSDHAPLEQWHVPASSPAGADHQPARVSP
ncbi:MFS transporter [Micromonospora thermarum]|uniref:MFS transporter n=1 Tax=Micromonospora thermarum TaxID=2720024 RepID=A0ABX0Z9X2_9ACTN|nr:MFS transporter [Micromonospora thermarum]NJP34273.1 MFS transporter [Micromonospora thermarum]